MTTFLFPYTVMTRTRRSENDAFNDIHKTLVPVRKYRISESFSDLVIIMT